MLFLFNSILLGTGLAMDAFSVSMVNGLKESEMPLHKMNLIAGVYAFFQFAMPMTGWICVHTILTYFKKFEGYNLVYIFILIVHTMNRKEVKYVDITKDMSMHYHNRWY